MKTNAKKTEDPPSETDLDGWRTIAAEDGFRRLRHEDVVAAIQRIGPRGDQKLLNALIGYISDEILRLLRKRIGRNHRNEGKDMIEHAHEKLIVAVLKPNSADGKGLRHNFKQWVRYRADDAIADEMRYRDRYADYQFDQEGQMVEPPDKMAPDHVEQIAYVEHLLSKISDPRKCLAFRLHMDGCPIGGQKGTDSIARALGVSDKTAGEWIEEVQTLLKTIGVTDGRKQ